MKRCLARGLKQIMKQTFPFLALASLWMVSTAASRPVTTRPVTKRLVTTRPVAASRPIASITYHTTFEKALKAAQKSKRPVLVYFHAAWCSPCKAMEDKVLTDARVVGAAKQWETVRADMDEESALAVRLKVERPPTLVFLTPQGHAAGRHEGYAEVAELLKVLRVAHAQAANTKPATKSSNTRAAPQKPQKSQKRSNQKQSNQKQQRRAAPNKSSR